MSSLAIDLATMDQATEGDQTALQPTSWTIQVDTTHRGLIAPVTLMTAEDTVTWYFTGVPAGCTPEIQFLMGENATPSPLGPFKWLTEAKAAENGFDFQITGFGNNGVNGSYSYGVLLIEPGAETIRSKIQFVEDPHIDNQGGPPTE
jgi:hypothetical protein